MNIAETITNFNFAGQLIPNIECTCGNVNIGSMQCSSVQNPWCITNENGSTYCPDLAEKTIGKNEYCCNHLQCKDGMACNNDNENKGFKKCQKAVLEEGDTCEHTKQCKSTLGNVDCSPETGKCTAKPGTLSRGKKCSNQLQCASDRWCGKKDPQNEEFFSCQDPYLKEGEPCFIAKQCEGKQENVECRADIEEDISPVSIPNETGGATELQSTKCRAKPKTVLENKFCSNHNQCKKENQWCGKKYITDEDLTCIPNQNHVDGQYCRTVEDCKRPSEFKCLLNVCKPDQGTVPNNEFCSYSKQCENSLGLCGQKDATKKEKKCYPQNSMNEGESCENKTHCKFGRECIPNTCAADDNICPEKICVANDNTVKPNDWCSRDLQCIENFNSDKTKQNKCRPVSSKSTTKRKCLILAIRGATCIEDDHCSELNAACISNKCSWKPQTRDVDERCDFDNQCIGNNAHAAGSKVCLAHKCAEIAVAGKWCKDSNDCVDDLMCILAKCATPVKFIDGSDCVANKECMSMSCIGKKCMAGLTPGQVPAGDLS